MHSHTPSDTFPMSMRWPKDDHSPATFELLSKQLTRIEEERAHTVDLEEPILIKENLISLTLQPESDAKQSGIESVQMFD
jgi:hypothetical protein